MRAKPSPGRQPQSGLSLIEALAALAVTGIGLVGVVAMQSTLRSNGELSRQRAEAVRIAQAELEQRRGFDRVSADAALTTPGPTQIYDNQSNDATTTVAGVSATYAVRSQRLASVDGGPYRALGVIVSWPDRTGATQSVELVSNSARMAPELMGGLALPGDQGPGNRPRGRAAAIPATATWDSSFKAYRFTPPGASADVQWYFNASTGQISTRCQGGTCVSGPFTFVSGFIRFGLLISGSEPLSQKAEVPDSSLPSSSAPISGISPVFVDTTSFTYPPICFTTRLDAVGAIAYYCSVYTGGGSWSGRLEMNLPTGAEFASDSTSADPSAARFRVCRYTPVANCEPRVHAVAVNRDSRIWADTSPGGLNTGLTSPSKAYLVGDKSTTRTLSGVAACPDVKASYTAGIPAVLRPFTNDDHPRKYEEARESIVNQNFLVIPAGNGSTAYGCPGDILSTPYVNGTTIQHQPALSGLPPGP